MANHLIIGLGGTGGRIVRSFRKKIYENFRSEEADGVNIRYLYVDSSDELMKHDDPSWKILGTSVQLQRTSQLLIRGLNLTDVLDNLNSYPGIAPWLGSRDQFRSIVTSADAANIVGGQKRRLGRFLFACKIQDYRQQVQALVREMQTGGTTQTVFHVCCGLAGGTGSGSIPDAVAQIRSMYPDAVNYRILIYALLPEKDPAGTRAGANYHANGYAALLELNALAVGSYQPYDLAAATPKRLELQDPFNCCYLFTDENEADNRVDIDTELPSITASFLYQKIVEVNRFTWDSLRRQETFEIGSQAKFPETSPATNRPERCRLFFSFGVKQIAYPQEEIREYLTYEFAKQATLQLQFNHWSDSSGYLDEAVNQSFSEVVKQKETLEHWRITDEHICLSLGILPDEIANKRWKPISTFWNDLLPNFKTHVRETFKDKKVWLDELSKLCETAFGQNYRDLGVRKFYDTKLGDLRDHAREIRRRIEIDLFSDWKNGVKSMYDISRLLNVLTSAIDERLTGLDDKAARSRENETKAEEKVALNRKEWAKIGVASELLGKRDRVFDAQSECLTELYIHRTRIQGWQFAKKLLESLSAEISNLSSEVGISNTMIAGAADDFKKAAEARCADQGSVDRTRQVVRFYDPEVVKTLSRRLTKDRATQNKQAALARQTIADILGEDQRFSQFNQRVSREKFTDALVKACEQSAVTAHNDLVSSDPTVNRILRVNIIEKLYREYGGNREALRSFVLDVVSRARSFLPTKDSEVSKTGPGIPGEAKVSFLTIIMPDAPEHKEFRELLADELANAKAGNKELITNPGTTNEITLVEITNVLPARFIRDLDFLRARYEARIALSTSALELHSEGDGQNLPSLYVRSVGPKEVFPYLLIGKAIGLVKQFESPETGSEEFYIVTTGERGRMKTIRLGKTFEEALERADGSVLDTLESLVGAALAGEYLHKVRREEISSAIQADVDLVSGRVKSPLDKTYKAYVEAADRADEILAPK